MGHTFWNLPTPPGFQSLSPEKPITFYMRHLPHWRQEGATYFVTFRQADSFPQEKLQELAALKQEWEKRNPSHCTDEQWQQFAHETMKRTEQWLDQGMGSCRLRHADARKIVTNALHQDDGRRYELGCYVVMPNHVHAIVRPLEDSSDSLEQVLKSWKGIAAMQINRYFGLTGPIWQQESFDRIIRDEEHLNRAIQYIGSNPIKAGLKVETVSRWVRPEWVNLGYRFEDA
jgi:putative transposase